MRIVVLARMMLLVDFVAWNEWKLNVGGGAARICPNNERD
jgi:hypothetical protein